MPGTGLVIHALPVLDGIVALSAMPGQGGDYAGDLLHLHDWQPALVVSLATTAEMQAGGAATLGNDLQDVGTRWLHLPTPDRGVPDAQAGETWQAISRVALGALRGGGRVLFHCRAGCGRSGMAVLRLMVEAGEPPDAALTRLRARRPCAVETDAQGRWATRV